MVDSVHDGVLQSDKAPQSTTRTPPRRSEETDEISEGNSSIQITPKEYLAQIKPQNSPQQSNSESPKEP